MRIARRQLDHRRAVQSAPHGRRGSLREIALQYYAESSGLSRLARRRHGISAGREGSQHGHAAVPRRAHEIGCVHRHQQAVDGAALEQLERFRVGPRPARRRPIRRVRYRARANKESELSRPPSPAARIRIVPRYAFLGSNFSAAELMQ